MIIMMFLIQIALLLHRRLFTLIYYCGRIAMFAPVVTQYVIVDRSTSISSVWKVLRLHYGFQATEYYNFVQSYECDEIPEALLQPSKAFKDSCRLNQTVVPSHYNTNEEVPTDDDSMYTDDDEEVPMDDDSMYTDGDEEVSMDDDSIGTDGVEDFCQKSSVILFKGVLFVYIYIYAIIVVGELV